MCLSVLDTLTLNNKPLDLQSSLQKLTADLGMLCGLSLSYGNVTASETLCEGFAQEALWQDGLFIKAEKPVTLHSLYDLASLTKLFTLVTVLQLIQKGKLHFEDIVGCLDKRFVKLGDTKLSDILSYQAVLRSPERIDSQPDAETAQRQIFLISRFLGPEPVKLYSDMNAMVLKYLIEQVSGYSYEDYLQKYIFSVLGMKDTFSIVPEDRLSNCLNYNYEHKILNENYILNKDTQPGIVHDPKARMMVKGGKGLPGHAGLFSTAQDMIYFVQGLLRGDLLHKKLLLEIGENRTGFNEPGRYRQYLGYLCFSKNPVQYFSEVPQWMGSCSFGLAGYTGNHLAIDPESHVFDLMLGNRCHMRVSQIEPSSQAAEEYHLSPDGAGLIKWPDKRLVKSSFSYIHQKDTLIHLPVYHQLKQRGWL